MAEKLLSHPINTTTIEYLGNESSGIGLPVVLAIIFAVICVFFIVGCLISKLIDSHCSRKENSSENGDRVQKEAIGNLIPPIFYTDKVKDPLLQEDLSDHALQKFQRLYP